MSKQAALYEIDYKESLKEAWKIPSKCDGFHQKFAVGYRTMQLLGVPKTYISISFLVATAYYKLIF